MAVVSQVRRRTLAQAEKTRDMNLLRETLVHWRSRYREKDLGPIVSVLKADMESGQGGC